MGQLNSTNITERNQRPSFNDRTILRAFFLRDGQYVPLAGTQVSSVLLFRKTANTTPSSILDASTGLVSDGAAAKAVWRWTPSGAGAMGSGVLLSDTDYSPATDTSCSSIYSLGTGKLAVVLNGVDDVSSVLMDGKILGSTSSLSGEPAALYIDVWTVKLCATCKWQVFISETQFFQNNTVLLSTPLLFNTSERLYNRRISLGSIEKLKIGTEVTIENKDIDNSIKNLLKEGLITSGSMEIMKHNDADQTLPAWVTVSGYGDTSSLVETTSDNTFLLKFNTSNLTNGSVANLGNGTGTYSVKLKYSILDETLISPLMYFTVT